MSESTFDFTNDPNYERYTAVFTDLSNNPQKYDFGAVDAAGNPEIRSLRPVYNNINDGLERDTKKNIEEQNNLFHASVITMTTLLISAIYISSRR
jgi:hypothetical protein